jgi:release factor glutamine methyltransferase
MPDTTPKTVAEIIAAGTNYLAGRNIEHPAIVCELLMSTLLGCKRLELPLHHNAVPGEKKLAAMRRGIKRTGAGEPVQYVLGNTEFMGHTFKVDRRALIPRPETEVLVQQILQCRELWQKDSPDRTAEDEHRPTIVDIGTGCGCIVISLAIAQPHALYIALDTNAEAVELAMENAASLNVADKVALSNAELSDTVEPEGIDAIVANLPYVPSAQYEQLPVNIREHEPRSALDGGPTGLSVIETVVQDSAIALKSGGRLFLEIGEDQAQAVTALLKETGFENIVVTKDLANRDRIIHARLTQ